ncbi:MAG: DUF4404 family protein [Candidatus Aureabacteria bacterium]|jgi:hypothetical protein|nr:DUF4404 family protein [Candidatus Auribacterota bacterium]HOE28107.1 DUF4404 family protein [bacterium]HQM52397.1 DUF4404 family protein [bacterium]
MHHQHLRAMIRELRAELANAAPVDADLRERIRGMLDEIEGLLEGGGEIAAQQHRQLVERLRESARHFEESHLPLTMAVGRLIDALSAIGI